MEAGNAQGAKTTISKAETSASDAVSSNVVKIMKVNQCICFSQMTRRQYIKILFQPSQGQLIRMCSMILGPNMKAENKKSQNKQVARNKLKMVKPKVGQVIGLVQIAKISIIHSEMSATFVTPIDQQDLQKRQST